MTEQLNLIGALLQDDSHSCIPIRELTLTRYH